MISVQHDVITKPIRGCVLSFRLHPGMFMFMQACQHQHVLQSLRPMPCRFCLQGRSTTPPSTIAILHVKWQLGKHQNRRGQWTEAEDAVRDGYRLAQPSVTLTGASSVEANLAVYGGGMYAVGNARVTHSPRYTRFSRKVTPPQSSTAHC